MQGTFNDAPSRANNSKQKKIIKSFTIIRTSNEIKGMEKKCNYAKTDASVEYQNYINYMWSRSFRR
jgi:hypothetical protein